MLAQALAALEPLVLASRSPQRRAILTQLGIAFTVVEPEYAEPSLPGVDPRLLALEHACGKARSVAARAVLGVDTVVEVDGEALGKPAAEDEARTMIRRLAGREHRVHSGLCLIRDGREHADVETTRVEFRALEGEDIDWYVAAGEWRGRAGGYAIQGRGAALAVRIDGDYSNVVGLPVPTFVDAVLRTALPSP